MKVGLSMELKWLTTFVNVYELGNFRLAAEKLYISQPSITVHIKLLEESLQVSLFERNHTQVKLTDEGKYFYKLAKDILEQVNQSKRAIQAYSNEQKIRITVALSPLLANTKIPQIIYAFSTQYPKYEIELLVEESKMLDSLIQSQKVHLAICIGKSQFKEIHSEKIDSSALELIYPSNHDNVDTPPNILLKDLIEKYPIFVDYLDELYPVVSLLEHEFPLLRKNSIKQISIVKQLILDGLGIAFLPHILVENDVLQGNLNRLKLPYSQFYKVDIFMRHLRESERLRPLINFIREKY